MAQFLQVHPQNPQARLIQIAVKLLASGGVMAVPTDSSYALVCHLDDKTAVDHLRRIRGVDERHHLTLLCRDLSDLSSYAKVDNRQFRLLKAATPGPFTFILEANAQVPKMLHSQKKTVGIRVPNHGVPRAIVDLLGHPILSTSLLQGEEDPIEYSTDPELIFEKYQHEVDLVIDGGYGAPIPSTILDCTGEEVVCLREGLGKLEDLL